MGFLKIIIFKIPITECSKYLVESILRNKVGEKQGEVLRNTRNFFFEKLALNDFVSPYFLKPYRHTLGSKSGNSVISLERSKAFKLKATLNDLSW